MELKKDPGVNLETGKTRNFLMGLVAALSLSLVAFEWRQSTVLITPPSSTQIVEQWEPENIPIVMAKPRELPAPQIDKTLPPKPDPDPKPIFRDPAPNPEPFIDPDVTGLFGYEEPLEDDTPPAPTRYPSSNPEFPGGEQAMFRYLQRNLKYPEMAKDYNVQGRVFVEFIVDVDGTIRDLKIRRGIPGDDLGCEEEAMRVIRSMPKWSPGMQGDRKVPVIYTLPINFVLK